MSLQFPRSFASLRSEPRALATALACALVIVSALAGTRDVRAAGATPASLGLIGEVRSVLGRAIGIDVQDHVAYLGDWGACCNWAGNMQTYDVTDPTAPFLLSNTATNYEEIGDVDIEGSRLFVANDALGLSVFDVSTPAAPFLTARRNDGVYAHSVTATWFQTASGWRLYAFVGHIYGGGLAIYDVTTPGPLPAPIVYHPNVRDVLDVQTDGTRLFVMVSDGSGNNRLEILDAFSLPAVPTVLGSLPMPAVSYGWIAEMRVVGNYVFCVGDSQGHVGGLRVVDVSNSSAPLLVGALDVPDMGGVPWKGAGLDVVGSRAFVVSTSALRVIDVSAPSAPSLMASYQLPADFGNVLGGHVKVAGDLAYVAAYSDDDQGGLAIFNVGPVDSQAPTASPTQDPVANSQGWNNQDVTVSWHWTDNAGGSGLDPGHCTNSTTSVGEGTLTLTATCQDIAGNLGSATYTLKVDKTPPTLSPVVTPNPVSLNQQATVTAHATDALSGVASFSCGAVPTSAVGTKSVTCSATDNAGNTNTAVAPYSVYYTFAGFFQPVDNLPTLNQIKAGSAVPVKFSLGGNQGLNIFAAGSPLSQLIPCDGSAPVDDVEQTVTAGGSSLSYSATTGQYTYVWKTDKAWAGTCRQLVVSLNDGATSYRANFRLK